jgi:hypothetical protein
VGGGGGRENGAGLAQQKKRPIGRAGSISAILTHGRETHAIAKPLPKSSLTVSNREVSTTETSDTFNPFIFRDTEATMEHGPLASSLEGAGLRLMADITGGHQATLQEARQLVAIMAAITLLSLLLVVGLVITLLIVTW